MTSLNLMRLCLPPSSVSSPRGETPTSSLPLRADPLELDTGPEVDALLLGRSLTEVVSLVEEEVPWSVCDGVVRRSDVMSVPEAVE